MKIHLSSDQIYVLQQVAKKNQIDIAPLLRVDRTLEIPDDIRQALLDAVVSEFCSTGLRPDSEPNQRGFALEEILAVLNRPNIMRKA